MDPRAIKLKYRQSFEYYSAETTRLTSWMNYLNRQAVTLNDATLHAFCLSALSGNVDPDTDRDIKEQGDG